MGLDEWLEDSPYLHSATRAERDAKRKCRRRRNLANLSFVLVVAACVIGFPLVQPHLYIPGTSYDPVYRANAIRVITEEIARLTTPYDEAHSLGQDESNAPGGPIDVLAFYALDSSGCSYVETTYGTRALQAGWSVEQPISSGHNVRTGAVQMSSTYRETVESLNLRLDVECLESDPYYDLAIFVA